MRAEAISFDSDALLSQAIPGCVYWLDLDNKGRTKLRSKPIDVSELLRAELFARCPSVSLVSATLTLVIALIAMNPKAKTGVIDFEFKIPPGAAEHAAAPGLDERGGDADAAVSVRESRRCASSRGRRVGAHPRRTRRCGSRRHARGHARLP